MQPLSSETMFMLILVHLKAMINELEEKKRGWSAYSYSWASN
jgi:hypothetical protein